MEHIIAQKTIAELVAIASKIVATNNVSPIADCIRIHFGKTGLSIEATNFDIWMKLSTEDFNMKGATVAIIPCKQFHSIISGIGKDQEINFTVTEKRLTIKTDSSQYRFGLLPDQEWPQIPWNEKAETINIKSSELDRAFKFVLPSVASDNVRHYLNGVNIRPAKGKTLRFLSSDGHKLSHIVIPTDSKAELKDGGVIFAKELISVYVDLINRLDSDIDLKIDITETKCRLEYEADYRVSVIGRMIDGQFPDVDRIITYERAGATKVIPRTKTMLALSRLSILAEVEKDLPVKIEFKSSSMKMSVSGKHGDAEEKISIGNSGEEDEYIHISIPKLQALLSAFDGEDISFCAGGISNAVLLTEDEATVTPDSGEFSVVMPMRG